MLTTIWVSETIHYISPVVISPVVPSSVRHPQMSVDKDRLSLWAIHGPCQTNLTHKMSQMSEQRFLHNLRSLNPFLKSEMPKNGQFFHKSRAKCAKMAFFGIFCASAHLNGGTQIFYFTANPSLGILFQRWEVENPFKITFFPYFGLEFTICHIPVIILIYHCSQFITGIWHIVNSKPK